MIIVGIDIGKRVDPSALVEVTGELDRPERTIGKMLTLPLGMSYTEQTKIMAARAGNGPAMVVIDAGGVGEVVQDTLRDKLPDMPIWGVVITGGGKARFNRAHRTACIPKTAMVKHLQALLEHDRLKFAEVSDPLALELISQIRGFKRHASGKIEAAIGEHDDLLLALCMALMGFRIVELMR